MKMCLVLLLSAVLCLSGCAGLTPGLESPEVAIARISVQDMDQLETVIQVDLRIFNSGEKPLYVKGIKCELELNGKKFARGVGRSDLEIPSYGTDRLTVSLYSSALDMIRGLINLRERDHFSYRISGHIRVEGASSISGRLPFSSEGSLAMGKEPEPEER